MNELTERTQPSCYAKTLLSAITNSVAQTYRATNYERLSYKRAERNPEQRLTIMKIIVNGGQA